MICISRAGSLVVSCKQLHGDGDLAIETIEVAAHTGKIGDGNIFVAPL